MARAIARAQARLGIEVKLAPGFSISVLYSPTELTKWIARPNTLVKKTFINTNSTAVLFSGDVYTSQVVSR